jgi:N-acetylmuramoyl-L-alanine amidase
LVAAYYYYLSKNHQPNPVLNHLQGLVVCIDPGHPTEFNSGMHHVRGLREVDINWLVSLKLRKALEDSGLRVILTKKQRDQLVSNPRRSITANDAGASLMIRIHCDAGPSQGYTIYYPNKVGYDGKNYGPGKFVRVASRIAAFRIRSGMNHGLNGILRDRGVRGESRTRVGEWKGALRGSVYVKVPVVTIEMVFLNNFHDSEFIKTDLGQNKMAKAIADGIILALNDSRILKPIKQHQAIYTDNKAQGLKSEN